MYCISYRICPLIPIKAILLDNVICHAENCIKMVLKYVIY